MTRREARDTEAMLIRLTTLLRNSTEDEQHRLQARDDAESLRRISMTLHRWHELECGINGGCIEHGKLVWFYTCTQCGHKAPGANACEECGDIAPVRSRQFESDENGAPYWADHNGERTRYHKIPDREAGALKRLAKIMARYPSLSSYVQGDPRGAALYILKPGDVPAGENVESYYSRGLAIHQ